MRRVIDGKLYDTEKATKIGSASQGYSNDFRHFEETLYVTKSGRFFLEGWGGPMSRWAESVDSNHWCSGSGIQVLSKSEALAWAEEARLSASTIERYFTIEEA